MHTQQHQHFTQPVQCFTIFSTAWWEILPCFDFYIVTRCYSICLFLCALGTYNGLLDHWMSTYNESPNTYICTALLWLCRCLYVHGIYSTNIICSQLAIPPACIFNYRQFNFKGGISDINYTRCRKLHHLVLAWLFTGYHR